MINKLGYTDKEITKITMIDGKKYLVKYNKIYQIDWSNAQKMFKCILIYTQPLREKLKLTKRGRHHFMDAKSINKLVEYELLTI